MVDSLRMLSLLAATLATGLMAGLYFAFSCAVMPGLARTDDRTFVAAMQWINVRILNGWFALAFGGAFVSARRIERRGCDRADRMTIAQR